MVASEDATPMIAGRERDAARRVRGRDLRIRPPVASERQVLVALWERSVRATHGFLGEDDIAFLRPLVHDVLTGDVLSLWVLANADDAPIGFLGLSGDSIEALFLEPEYRGRGCGRRLVEYAQSLLGGSLSVAVNEQNEAARGFYEALGFVVVGRSPLDAAGLPFPLLHMRRPAPGR